MKLLLQQDDYAKEFVLECRLKERDEIGDYMHHRTLHYSRSQAEDYRDKLKANAVIAAQYESMTIHEILTFNIY